MGGPNETRVAPHAEGTVTTFATLDLPRIRLVAFALDAPAVPETPDDHQSSSTFDQIAKTFRLEAVANAEVLLVHLPLDVERPQILSGSTNEKGDLFVDVDGVRTRFTPRAGSAWRFYWSYSPKATARMRERFHYDAEDAISTFKFGAFTVAPTVGTSYRKWELLDEATSALIEAELLAPAGWELRGLLTQDEIMHRLRPAPTGPADTLFLVAPAEALHAVFGSELIAHHALAEAARDAGDFATLGEALRIRRDTMEGKVPDLGPDATFDRHLLEPFYLYAAECATAREDVPESWFVEVMATGRRRGAWPEPAERIENAVRWKHAGWVYPFPKDSDHDPETFLTKRQRESVVAFFKALRSNTAGADYMDADWLFPFYLYAVNAAKQKAPRNFFLAAIGMPSEVFGGAARLEIANRYGLAYPGGDRRPDDLLVESDRKRILHYYDYFAFGKELEEDTHFAEKVQSAFEVTTNAQKAVNSVAQKLVTARAPRRRNRSAARRLRRRAGARPGGAACSSTSGTDSLR